MTARLLLVHSPLVGPATWDLVAGRLAERGYEVNVPDLTATVAAPPPYCPRQAEAIAGSASGQPSIFIGHSGAGPLLAAAGALTGQARGYIFADAGLPIPGQTWMETVPPELASQVREMADARGWLPPWPHWWGDEVLAELIPDPDQRRRFAAGCPPLPLAMFEEIHPAVPDWPDAPAGYLQLSEAYHGQAEMAKDLGWPVIMRDSHHLAPFTDPGMVAASLHELIDRLRLSHAPDPWLGTPAEEPQNARASLRRGRRPAGGRLTSASGEAAKRDRGAGRNRAAPGRAQSSLNRGLMGAWHAGVSKAWSPGRAGFARRWRLWNVCHPRPTGWSPAHRRITVSVGCDTSTGLLGWGALAGGTACHLARRATPPVPPVAD